MKKIILGIIFLFLIVIFAGSFLTGPMTKWTLESQIAEINKMPGYQAELVEYNSGWRKADGKIRIGIDWDFYTALSAKDLTPEQKVNLAEMPDHLLLDMRIAHGPILANKLTNNWPGIGLSFIQFTPDVSDKPSLKLFQEKAKVDTLFTYQTLIGLFGNSSFSLDSPQLKFVDEPSVSHFSFGGTQIEGSYHLGSKEVTFEGAFLPLKLVSEEASFEISVMELSADLVMLNQMASLGDMEFKIAKMSGVSQDQQTSDISEFSMADLLIRYEGEKDSEETVKMAVQYAIGDMVVGDQGLSDMNFQMAFERLGLSTLEKYYEFMINLVQNTSDEAVLQQQQLAAMSELGAEFLEHSPAVDIPDISFVMDDGKFSANARVDFDGKSMDISPDDLANPLALMDRLKVNSGVNVDQNMLDTLGIKMLSDQIKTQLAAQDQQMPEHDINELAENQLQTLIGQQVQQGMIMSTADGYRASFSMDKGAMKLNGKPFSPF